MLSDSAHDPARERAALELCQQLRVREVILPPISNSPDWELARRAGHARRAGEPLRNVIAINRQLAEVDELIDDRFSEHRLAPIITSMVGIGDPLGAEFLAAAGDVRTRFESADHLAGYAGLAPIPRDSHTRSGNLHRPRRYNRQLQRVFYTPAISIQHSIASRAFYDRNRAEGKRHTQAVMALARRRANVLWAMLRDQRRYLETPIDGAPAA